MGQRNQNIELLRIAAAFGIVLFHSGASGAPIGYAGLIAFTVLSTHFAGGNPVKLAKRVLIPWVFWTIFYLGWRYAADGSPFHAGLDPISSILYGSHLWFLPFIFVANLMVLQVNSRHLPMICAVLAFGLLVATPWWRELQLAFDPPVAQYLHALPAALIGVAIRTRAGMAISAIGLVVSALWQVPGISLAYGIGGGLVLAAMLMPRNILTAVSGSIESLSACMLGVYLVHIAALGVFNRITGPSTLLTVVLAFVASLAGVWLTRRFVPVSKWVLG
jgi:surface polysaccharide O-acyltransferase-like enzyme